MQRKEPIFKSVPKKTDFSTLTFRNNTTAPEFTRKFDTMGGSGERIPYDAKPKVNVDIAVEDEPLPQKTEEKTKVTETKPIIEETPEVILIGEAFSTYIVVQMGDSIFLIDKHAAHERILFNKLKEEQTLEVQALLTPITSVMPREEYDAIIGNLELLENSGFEIEDFGNSAVIVRAVPAVLAGEDTSSLLSEIAEGIIKTGKVSSERQEDIFHTVACRAAIKAGNVISRTEMLELAKKVLPNKDIMYCPHGRPVAFEITKRELEKQFGRIQ